MKQTDLVKEWLESGKTLTSQEAWEKWGITRLSQAIMLLRRSGCNIKTIIVEGTNRYGEPTKYGRYKLEDCDEKSRGVKANF